MSAPSSFWNRPIPREGPNIPFKGDNPSNPVVRGYPLAALATLIKSSTLIQSVLWKLNKFDQIKNIPQLTNYTPRYDPTVVPIITDSSTTSTATTTTGITTAEKERVFTISDLPPPQPRLKDINYYTSADYHKFYKTGVLTPLDVVEYLLGLIVRKNGDDLPPNRYAVAFLDSKVELIRDAARASTERYKLKCPLSPLDGVPVAVKDEIEVAGYRKMEGSMIDFTNPADETGWCVKKWEEVGAIIIGKTNMHEIGLDTTNNNPNYGTPLNPHNEDYYTGGSSGGSACAVGQGIVPIALGADGGGSIRIPANFCGVYGLKPSHGRISSRPTADLAVSVGVYGPIASNIDDLSLAYRIMAQPDRQSTASSAFPNSLSRKTVQYLLPSRKIIGIPRAWVARSDPIVAELFENAIQHYAETQRYEIVDISIPFLTEGQKAHAMTILSEVRMGISPEQLSQLSYPNQVLLTVAGSHASTQDFLAAQRLRNLQMEHLAYLWQEYPEMLILTPTTPFAGWKIGHRNDVRRGSYGVSDSDTSLRSMEYVYLANWTGCPALSRPMGYTQDNVPVGLMAMGDWGSEEQLLLWAREGEELLTGGAIRRPQDKGVWVDVIWESIN